MPFFLPLPSPNRHKKMNVRFGDDLSEAVEIVTEGCLATPFSLGNLEKIWTEYNLAQEMIQLCRNVVSWIFSAKLKLVSC